MSRSYRTRKVALYVVAVGEIPLYCSPEDVLDKATESPKSKIEAT